MKEVLRALSADIEYTGELGRDAVEEANEVARDTILFLPFVRVTQPQPQPALPPTFEHVRWKVWR